MYTDSINSLPLYTVYPLHMQATTTGPLIWHRVGRIMRTASRVSVVFDDATRHARPAWTASTERSTDRSPTVGKVCFGVFLGRAGMSVIARGALTTNVLGQAREVMGARRPRRRRRAVAHRPLRTSWLPYTLPEPCKDAAPVLPGASRK